jgi:hypothetical protein
LTEIGFGRVMPRAAPTVAPVGQLPAAAVAVRLGSGAVVADVVVAAVADAVADGAVAAGVAAADGAPPPEPPQAERVAPKISAVTANRRGLLCDT